MWARVFTAALFLFTVQPADAARFSGDYLIEMCSNNTEGEELIKGGHIACQAYIAGVMDYHNVIRSLGTAPSVDFCVPDQSAMYTLQNTVVRYLKKHKEQQGPFIAAPGVALGLYSKFPCKPSSQNTQ